MLTHTRITPDERQKERSQCAEGISIHRNGDLVDLRCFKELHALQSAVAAGNSNTGDFCNY